MAKVLQNHNGYIAALFAARFTFLTFNSFNFAKS